MWEEGFSVFCEGLASNNSLIQLDLRNNQVNHQGAAEIALALKRNSVLRELGGCWPGDTGIVSSALGLLPVDSKRDLVAIRVVYLFVC